MTSTTKINLQMTLGPVRKSRQMLLVARVMWNSVLCFKEVYWILPFSILLRKELRNASWGGNLRLRYFFNQPPYPQELKTNNHVIIYCSLSEKAKVALSFCFIISAQEQMEVAVGTGAMQYDMLFDYYEQLRDPRASEVVKKYYNYIKDVISPELKERNKWRFSEGHLTYPYLEHYWLPNGIQT